LNYAIHSQSPNTYGYSSLYSNFWPSNFWQEGENHEIELPDQELNLPPLESPTESLALRNSDSWRLEHHITPEYFQDDFLIVNNNDITPAVALQKEASPPLGSKILSYIPPAAMIIPMMEFSFPLGTKLSNYMATTLNPGTLPVEPYYTPAMILLFGSIVTTWFYGLKGFVPPVLAKDKEEFVAWRSYAETAIEGGLRDVSRRLGMDFPQTKEGLQELKDKVEAQSNRLISGLAPGMPATLGNLYSLALYGASSFSFYALFQTMLCPPGSDGTLWGTALYSIITGTALVTLQFEKFKDNLMNLVLVATVINFILNLSAGILGGAALDPGVRLGIDFTLQMGIVAMLAAYRKPTAIPQIESKPEVA